MKPRFNLSFYPLAFGQLWIVLTEVTARTLISHRTILDAEEAAMFRRL
jgi:hypothetical protein